MELVKPEPLVIGGRAHYTLTSYDPVSIDVDVPYTTEEDVEYALQVTVAQAGGGPAQLNDDAWMREQFEDVSGVDEMRALVRDEVRAMHAHMAEEQKAARCASALAKRLEQRVPQEHIDRVRASLVQSFAMSLRADGMSQEDYLTQSGMRPADIEAMFKEQAKATAEHEAAIDAWIEHRRLQVSDDEIPRLVGVEPDDVEEFVAELKRRSPYEIQQIRELALRNKAMVIVVAECRCTYHHETATEASARVARMRAMLQEFSKGVQDAEAREQPTQHPHLKLV